MLGCVQVTGWQVSAWLRGCVASKEEVEVRRCEGVCEGTVGEEVGEESLIERAHGLVEQGLAVWELGSDQVSEWAVGDRCV